MNPEFKKALQIGVICAVAFMAFGPQGILLAGIIMVVVNKK